MLYFDRQLDRLMAVDGPPPAVKKKEADR
jgi:hypothetical protein